MISKQLLNYIEKEDKLGKSKDDIEHILLAADWHEDAVSEALDIYFKKGKKKDKKTEKTEFPSEVNEEENPVEAIQTKVNTEAKLKEKKTRVRPIFLIILSFVLGAAIMLAISMFSLNNQVEDTVPTVQNVGGFEAQKIDDGKRIAAVLEIQKSLEKYYTEHKSYPENINSLTDAPTASSELNYTYTPIGSPPQSYMLNVELENTDDGAFKVEGGFMTLKNKRGTK